MLNTELLQNPTVLGGLGFMTVFLTALFVDSVPEDSRKTVLPIISGVIYTILGCIVLVVPPSILPLLSLPIGGITASGGVRFTDRYLKKKEEVVYEDPYEPLFTNRALDNDEVMYT